MKKNLGKFLFEGEADEATKWDDIETFGELSEEEMNSLLDDLDEADENEDFNFEKEENEAKKHITYKGGIAPVVSEPEEGGDLGEATFFGDPDDEDADKVISRHSKEFDDAKARHPHIYEDDMDEELDEAELNEDELNEDESSNDSTMSDEDLKIESLKIATNIAKLMSDVTTEDIISIADKVSGFIRNHNIDDTSSEEEPKEESSEEAPEDLDFEIPEEGEEEKEEK